MGRIVDSETQAYLEKLDAEGRMGAILTALNRKAERGLCTQEELGNDLDAALWRSYALNNIDTYQAYVQSKKFLKQVEPQGARNGVWCYRYSVTLMYLKRYEESLHYARQGTASAPEYPWGWLQLAHISCQAGLRDQALAAVEQGLLLVPGDYEFLTAKREIEEGRPFSEMVGHYIDPEADEEFACPDKLDRLEKEKALTCNKKSVKFED